LTDFEFLESLDLSGNKLEELPINFTLSCSKELYANSCDLNHNRLKAIVECTKLEKLEISINNFEEISNDLKSSLKNFDHQKLRTYLFWIESILRLF
jgi:hypothetical protein